MWYNVRLMNKAKNIYNKVALFLAAVFLLFNIGLPIVVASCPMAQNPHRPACEQCSVKTERGSHILARLASRSCCATVFASERNTTAFLHVKKDVVHYASIHTSDFTLKTASLPAVSPLSHGLRIGLPSPRAEDIPVFTSSLLL